MTAFWFILVVLLALFLLADVVGIALRGNGVRPFASLVQVVIVAGLVLLAFHLAPVALPVLGLTL